MENDKTHSTDKLVLLGAGGHCKSVLDSLLSLNSFSDIVITDPNVHSGTKILGCEVVGTDDCLKELKDGGFNNAFITVGSVGINPIRKKTYNELISMGFSIPVILDPSAVVSKSAIIGCGTYVGKNAVINADAKIGENCIINTGAVVEHECIVNSFSHISVGSILCGGVQVGENSFVGAGSTLIQCVHIGNNVIIGANSTVLADVDSDTTCYGIVNGLQ